MITSEKLDARPQLKVLLTQILAVKMYGGPQPHHEALAEVYGGPQDLTGSENLTDLKISFTAHQRIQRPGTLGNLSMDWYGLV